MSKPKKTEPAKPEPNEQKKALQVLVPALAIAGVVLLIVIIVNMGSPTANSTKPLPPGAAKFDRFALDGPEWKPLGGGLKYWDAKEGTGEPCPAGANVTVHYTGWTLDGKEFDSSKKTGKPFTTSLANVVKGWTDGIPGMKAGTVRRLYIPSEMAYGKRGAGKDIPPDADLVFEVEMIGYQ